MKYLICIDAIAADYLVIVSTIRVAKPSWNPLAALLSVVLTDQGGRKRRGIIAPASLAMFAAIRRASSRKELGRRSGLRVGLTVACSRVNQSRGDLVQATDLQYLVQ